MVIPIAFQCVLFKPGQSPTVFAEEFCDEWGRDAIGLSGNDPAVACDFDSVALIEAILIGVEAIDCFVRDIEANRSTDDGVCILDLCDHGEVTAFHSCDTVSRQGCGLLHGVRAGSDRVPDFWDEQGAVNENVRGGRGHERVLQFSLCSANLARWILH